MRFDVDGSWRRYGRVVVAGSPLRIFRLTAAGAAVATALESGHPVERSRLLDRLLDGGAVHPRPEGGARLSRADVTIVTPQLGGTVVADGRIVVDDGSRPALDGAALRLPTNRGPAAARNAGRTLATTPLIAFVDADVTLPPGWLDALLPHFDDDCVGLVAPRVIGERRSPLDMGDAAARVRAGTRVSYVPGAAIVVRATTFDAVGGFDERMRYGEDVDFVWRLDESGWTCRYEPASSVEHTPRPTFRSRMRQHAGYGTSAAPLAIRHPNSLAPMVSNGWTAAMWTLVALGHPAVAASVATGSSAALIRKLPGLPAGAAFGLAMRGHLGAARQIAKALRREWWPLIAVGALFSKRLRWGLAAAVAVDIPAVPTDLAYGWGVWTGMRRLRTLRPIVPRLISWPDRNFRRNYGRRT